MPVLPRRCKGMGKKISEREKIGWYIAGFVDGEGSFNVSLKPHSKMKFGWVVDPVFQVYQHVKRVDILRLIKENLRCGRIKKKTPYSGTMVYIVDNRRDLIEKVIPFFDHFKILSSKREDYEKFKDILLRMKRKEHLTLDGLKEIVKIACSMNEMGKQRKYSAEYVLRSLEKSSETIRQALRKE